MILFLFLCSADRLYYTVVAKSLKLCNENMLRAETIKRCGLQPAACLLQTMPSRIQQSCTSFRGAVRTPCSIHISSLSNSWPVACLGKPANKAYCHCSHSRDSWVNVFMSFWRNMELLGSTSVEYWGGWGLFTLALLSSVLLCAKCVCVRALSLCSPPSPFLKDRLHIFHFNLLI